MKTMQTKILLALFAHSRDGAGHLLHLRRSVDIFMVYATRGAVQAGRDSQAPEAEHTSLALTASYLFLVGGHGARKPARRVRWE
jgi:hypothetical protein